MLFDLPLEIQKIINEYEEDYLPKKFSIIKNKIQGEISHTQLYLSKVSGFNKIFAIMNDVAMDELPNESLVGPSFNNWIHNIKRELVIPEDIREYTQNKRQKLGHYEQLNSRCEAVINNHCKHKVLKSESDYDYHRPRYEFHCILCHTQVYRYQFKKDTRIMNT